MTAVAAPEGSVDEQIGFVVFMLMYQKHLTQKAMAEHLGIQQSSMSRKLRGTRPWLATDICTAASVLGVAPSELMPKTATATQPPDDGGPTSTPTMRRYTGCDELTTRRLRRSPTRPGPGQAPAAQVAS